MGGRGTSSGIGGRISFRERSGLDSTKYLDPGKFQNQITRRRY